uniref:Uncharacterized protein n=1 Tax=Chromera velia CCMP2878 TaxID=1169474 RepID=A0A0G4I3U7_9ALVE|eukprot:Cvel_35611.t1-p1 / transcript=Cvel_35611.t1 / gene=Cvel_35611 / organism=Chromera_velia_CCMP2878 / gene_product=hypothetical protein / transcript_product=hypothetical protein / location=Cvel_scaffold6581:454-1359(+) / protein_length=302 / sequence_SO=supercontig / SO=protein_coding / is_pseudo=false
MSRVCGWKHFRHFQTDFFGPRARCLVPAAPMVRGPALHVQCTSICRAAIPTDRHIDPRLRPALAAVIEEIVDRLGDEDAIKAERAWKALAYFPSIFFRKDRRGGHASLSARRRRIKAFWEGDFETLVRSLHEDVVRMRERQKKGQERRGRRSMQQRTEDDLASKRRQVQGLIEEGALSKAASRLQSFGVAPATTTTFRKTAGMFPRRAHPLLLRDPSQDARQGDSQSSEPTSSAFPSLSQKNLLEAIRSAPKGSAQEVTGWQYEHLGFFLPRDGSAQARILRIAMMLQWVSYHCWRGEGALL